MKLSAYKNPFKNIFCFMPLLLMYNSAYYQLLLQEKSLKPEFLNIKAPSY